MENWPSILGWIALASLVLLLLLGAWSLINTVYQRRKVGAHKTYYVNTPGLPGWTAAVGWVLAAIMIVSVGGAFVGKIYQRDHTPTPEYATVIMPVVTTDSGERILQIRERHGITIPLVCKAEECDGLKANERIIVDTHIADDKRIYENPRKES